jgi:capsular exopolysaccharide synthesis family protein
MMELKQKEIMAKDLLKAREAQLGVQVHAPEAEAKAMHQAEDNQTYLVMDITWLNQKIEFLKYQKKIQMEAFSKQKDDFSKMFLNAQLLSKETADIDHNKELFKRIREQIDVHEMESKVPGAIQVVARAFEPSEPEKDRRLPLSLVSIIGAIVAGLATAFLRVKLNPMISEADDFLSGCPTPFLGYLPLTTDGSVPYESPLQKEYIRMVRTCLLHRLPKQHGNAIVITSADKGAGKTTFAIQLAKSIAECGKKVLLVDSDLRNPSLSERFGISQGPGLLALMTPETMDREVIIPVEPKGLEILAAGNFLNGIFQEFLANGVFKTRLDRWRENYDIVIFDSPPVLPVADARILSRISDGTVMVVRQNHCQRESVVEALASLSAAGGKLLGTVYIGSHQRRNYGYHYGGYYGNKASQPINVVVEEKEKQE